MWRATHQRQVGWSSWQSPALVCPAITQSSTACAILIISGMQVPHNADHGGTILPILEKPNSSQPLHLYPRRVGAYGGAEGYTTAFEFARSQGQVQMILGGGEVIG